MPFGSPRGLPLRPGFDLRQPGRHQAPAELNILGRFLAVQATRPSQRSESALQRHTHGSYLMADGVPLPVADRLGQSSVRTTADVYTHALRGPDDDAALRWDEFQRRGAGDSLQRKLQ
jgi:hypothetical protein